MAEDHGAQKPGNSPGPGLGARGMRSNLGVLVTLRKGNHPGEAEVAGEKLCTEVRRAFWRSPKRMQKYSVRP